MTKQELKVKAYELATGAVNASSSYTTTMPEVMTEAKLIYDWLVSDPVEPGGGVE